ncbi:MAG: peptidylprolyl isomerase [Deltaproteobacteria bacterium]|nr:peptidylprolyl isomerase [Deltaproteobacteria bacterium]
MTRAHVFTALIALVTACDRLSIRDRNTIVEITGPSQAVDTVERDELELALARIRKERGDRADAKLPERVVLAVLLRHIEHHVLLMEAARLGIKGSTTSADRGVLGMKEERGDRAFASALIAGHYTESEVREGLVEGSAIAQLLTTHAHASVRVEDHEIPAAYEKLPADQKLRNERARARHIVVRTREEGNLILEKLKKGASFAQLARAHSIAPEAASGGDLGWIERGTMPAVFEECFKLSIGTPSPLVPSEYGFHVFLVEAREGARALSFDELKDRLARDLWTQKLDLAERAYVDGVRDRYLVEIRQAALHSLR